MGRKFKRKASLPSLDKPRKKKSKDQGRKQCENNPKNIAELANTDIVELADWFNNLEEHLSEKQLKIAEEVIKEIKTRLQFLLDVGLDYLALNRSSKRYPAVKPNVFD